MKYFLWIEGQKSGPYTVDEIKNILADRDVSCQVLVRGEQEQDWQPLDTILKEQDAATVPNGPPAWARRNISRASTRPDPNSRAATQRYLDQLRENTCYRTLRKAANALLFIALFVVVSGLVTSGIARWGLGPSFASLWTGLVLLAEFMSAACFLVVLKHVLILIADMADLRLHERADNLSTLSSRRKNAEE